MSDFHHLAALAFAELGEPAEAKAHYLLAKDLDWFPLRATSQYNDMIRRQARERDLVLLDAERIIQGAAVDGIPGWDMFFDACHLRPQGHRLIAQSLCEIISTKYFSRASGSPGDGVR